MKKETILAIALGLILGSIFALTLVVNIKKKELEDKKIASPTIVATIKPTIVKMEPFNIIEPTSDYLTNKETILIKGKAEKNSLIVVQSPTSEKVFKTIKNDFSLEFPLSLGENLIRITNYQKNNTEEKLLKVYYLKE